MTFLRGVIPKPGAVQPGEGSRVELSRMRVRRSPRKILPSA